LSASGMMHLPDLRYPRSCPRESQTYAPSSAHHQE
jgi:hypothetical protein